MSGKRYSVSSINDVRLPPNLLKDMSIEFLRTLDSQNEGTFYEFFQQLPLEDVKTARSGCERQQEINRQLALENTDKEPQFTEAKEELRRLVTEANDLKTEYDREYEELKRLQNRTEPSTLRKQLQDATKLSETTSEDFATDFVNGKSSVSVEEFVEGLVSQRSQFWLRKVKLEKFDDLAKSRRPVPVPRSRGPPTEGPSSSYTASQGSSLPVGSPSSMTAPTQSLPPYPPASTSGMPQPARQPFPAAAYPGYQQQQPQQSVYPPPGRSFPQPQPVRPTGYSQAPPPRPTSYNQYKQHRY